MTTGKVEINSAVAEKSVDEQVKELNEQGVDINTLQSTDGSKVIASEPDTQVQNIENQISARECPVVIIPYHRDPLMQLIYCQIICYKIVIEQKNHNPDYPKNIAKVVTVD